MFDLILNVHKQFLAIPGFTRCMPVRVYISDNQSCVGARVQFEIESLVVIAEVCNSNDYMYIDSEVFGADTQRSYGEHYHVWSEAGRCGNCGVKCSMPISNWDSYLNLVANMTSAYCSGADTSTECNDWFKHGKKDSYGPFANYTNTNTLTVVGDDNSFFLISTLVIQQNPGVYPYYAFVMANCSATVNENSIRFSESFYYDSGSDSGVSIAGNYKCLKAPTTTTNQPTSTDGSTLTSTTSSTSTETSAGSSTLTSTDGSTSTEITASSSTLTSATASASTEISQQPDSKDKLMLGLKVGLVVLALTTCVLSVSLGYLVHVISMNKRKVAGLVARIPPEPGTSDATGDYEFHTWS